MKVQKVYLLQQSRSLGKSHLVPAQTLPAYKNYKRQILHVLVFCAWQFRYPADSLIISLGIGLSITLKAGRGMLRWLWGAVVQWSEHLQLKQEALALISSGYPVLFFFLFHLAYSY